MWTFRPYLGSPLGEWVSRRRSERSMTNDVPAQAQMGQRIRDLRKKRKLTLQDVADKARLAVSTMSKIERGLLAPTYDKFSRIAAALDVDIISLYASDSAQLEEGAFLIARDGETVAQKNETYTYEILFSQASGKAMLPAVCDLRPIEEMNVDSHIRHPGQEFIYVLAGTAIVHLENRPPAILNVGDSAYFDSNQGHIYSAAGKEGARVLFLTAPPSNAREREEIRHSGE